jgi:hypothetical protein
MIRFHCPKCESEMEVDESFAGRGARCPTCGTNMKVPKKGEAPPPPATKASQPRPGSATVKVDGQQVEIVPPLETMVVTSMVFLGAAVLGLLTLGVLLGSTLRYPWTVGGFLGMILALMGTLTALPAYHSIRRSRGRKRGRLHAQVCMGGGGGLFLICTVIFLVGLAQILNRATCEENLKRIDIALWAYAEKHDGAFPQSLRMLVEEKYISPETVTCPAYNIRIGEQSYQYVPDINVKNPLFPPDMMVVSDGEVPPPNKAHEDGCVRVLLLNHQVVMKSDADWAAYKKAQGEKWNDVLNKIRRPAGAKKEEPPPPPKEQETPAPATPAPAAPAPAPAPGDAK